MAGAEVIEDGGDEVVEPGVASAAATGIGQSGGKSGCVSLPSLLNFRIPAGTGGIGRVLAGLSGRRELFRPGADCPFSQSTSFWRLLEASTLTIRVTALLRCKVGSS